MTAIEQLTDEILALKEQLATVTKERDEALAKLRLTVAERDAERGQCAVLSAKCAEMRNAIVKLVSGLHHKALNDPTILRMVDHALSSDCGKGWRSPSEYAALEAKCGEMREALTEITIQECLNEHPDECVCCLDESEIKTIAQDCLDDTDCGKGWRSPEEWAALEAKCAEMREEIQEK